MINCTNNKNFFLTLFAFASVYSVASPGFAQIYSERQRDLVKQKEMECIAKYFQKGEHIPWDDACYSWSVNDDTREGARARKMTENFAIAERRHLNQIAKAQYKHIESGAAGEQIHELTSASSDLYQKSLEMKELSNDALSMDYEQEPYSHNPFSRHEHLTKFEFGGEVSKIRYAEPDFMKEKGDMYGVFSSFTYRPMNNNIVRSFPDFMTSNNKINMYRVDARLSWGQVDYESEGTGEIDNIDNWMFEGRGVAGYDIPLSEIFRITPYFGAGYRYLRDEVGGLTSTTGHFGYDRESHYIYLPLGLDTQIRLPKGWSISFLTEYDLFLDGKQKSHLEDVLAGLETLENDQNEGWGARGSIRIMKETKNVDFFVEPFIRYWDIDDSEISIINFMGQPTLFAGLEPANTSEQYGIMVGTRF